MEKDPDVMMAKFNRAKRTMFISIAVAVIMLLLGSLVLDILALGLIIFVVVRFIVIKSKAKKLLGVKHISENTIAVRYFPANGTLYSPEKPVDADLASGFVYPGMREKLSECAKDYLRGEHHIAIFRIKYRGTSYMEIYVNPGLDETKGEMTLDWLTYVVHFNPKRFRSGEVLERFEKCSLYNDFSYDEPAKAQGNDAVLVCGADGEKAMKIASYLISGICYFPLDTQLAYDHVFLDLKG